MRPQRRVTGEQLLAAVHLHEESKWEESGGWRHAPPERRDDYKMERDASMVQLLNLIDPESLVDKPRNNPDGTRRVSITEIQKHDSIGSNTQIKRIPSEFEQHSALTKRGIALVGTSAAIGWYMLRLVVRDLLSGQIPPSARRNVLELHALSTVHSTAWVLFLLKKMISPVREWPTNCSRALVGSLGFYLHDIWVLRSTLLHNPSMLAHQIAHAVCIGSILRSKGVAWLALPLMSQAFPTLAQEMLQFSGTIGLPATRPEVKALRLWWFLSFAASKLALVPLWARYKDMPELHQPNLLKGKLSYLVALLINVSFMASAARDLPKFLLPKGAVVPVATAYRVPLKGVQTVGTFVTSVILLGGIFGLYLTAPAAAAAGIMAACLRSKRLGIFAGGLGALVALDQILPQPKECHPKAKLLVDYGARKVMESFGHTMYPTGDLNKIFKDKDKSYLLALSPHGFFPWGVSTIIGELLDAGFLPNFVGASVLGALPLAGRFLRFYGYRPASKQELQHCLAKPYPRNVTIIVPGGIREMFCIREDIEISAADAHSGFARVAVENGAMLVPAYSFGTSQMYSVARGQLAQLCEYLSRKFKMSISVFSGRWGTLLPYAHRMATAFAEPIDAKAIGDHKEVHRLFCEGLRGVFDTYKADFGWPDRELYYSGEEMPPAPRDPLDAYTYLPALSRL